MRLALIALVALLAACEPLPPVDPGLVERTSGQANPSDAERRVVTQQTFAYWRALDRRRWEDAFDFHTDDYRERMPFSDWRVAVADSRPGPLELRLIDWSKSFARYEGPELYAIIEWRAGPVGAGLEGLFVWRQEPDGGFLLENFEERAR